MGRVKCHVSTDGNTRMERGQGQVGLGGIGLEVMLKVWEWMEWPRKWTWSVEGRAEGETPGTSQPRDSLGEGGASWSLREEKGA